MLQIKEMLNNKAIRNRIIVLGICVATVLVLLVNIIIGGVNRKKADKIYEEMRTQQSNVAPEGEGATSRTEAEAESTTEADLGVQSESEPQGEEESYPDFAKLQEENPDIYAWISIPDTSIEYPVLQHATDNAYYLEYNLDGSKGRPGCIYSEKENSKDFTDFQTILYGHNMRNGTMFHDLTYFVEEDYFAQHPYIIIYTEAAIYRYRIFAAYEYSDEHLLYAFSYDTEEGRERYIERIAGYNVLGDEAKLSADSKILTLSTCVTGEADRRLLVQGVLIEE